MDEAELKATIARLDAMRDRCDALVKRDKPLQPDRTVGRKRLTADYEPVRPAQVTRKPQATGSGQLAGNEMRIPPGYRPQKPMFVDVGDGSLESIFADFEAQFDEMTQAHRG